MTFLVDITNEQKKIQNNIHNRHVCCSSYKQQRVRRKNQPTDEQTNNQTREKYDCVSFPIFLYEHTYISLTECTTKGDWVNMGLYILMGG